MNRRPWAYESPDFPQRAQQTIWIFSFIDKNLSEKNPGGYSTRRVLSAPIQIWRSGPRCGSSTPEPAAPSLVLRQLQHVRASRRGGHEHVSGRGAPSRVDDELQAAIGDPNGPELHVFGDLADEVPEKVITPLIEGDVDHQDDQPTVRRGIADAVVDTVEARRERCPPLILVTIIGKRNAGDLAPSTRACDDRFHLLDGQIARHPDGAGLTEASPLQQAARERRRIGDGDAARALDQLCHAQAFRLRLGLRREVQAALLTGMLLSDLNPRFGLVKPPMDRRSAKPDHPTPWEPLPTNVTRFPGRRD